MESNRSTSKRVFNWLRKPSFEWLRRKSIRYILLTPWLLVILYFAIVSTSVGLIVRHHLEGYTTELADLKTAAIDTTLGTLKANLRQAIDYQRYSDYFRGLLVNRNFFDLNYSLKRTADGFALPGYILTELDGSIIASNYNDLYDQKELVKLASYVNEHDFTEGYGKLYKESSCQFAASIIRTLDNKPSSVLVYIGYVANNIGYLNGHKMQQQVDFITFDYNKFVCSTDTNIVTATLTPEIIAATDKLQNWIGEYKVNDEIGYIVSAIPMKEYDSDENLSTMLICIDDNIVRAPINKIRLILIFSVLGAIIIILLVIYVTNNYITRPVKHLTQVVQTIATGDLSHSVTDMTSGIEIVTLNRGINAMQENIRSVVSPIVNNNRLMINTINQLSAASSAISEAANSQAASLEEISASMEEMEANIQNNTANSVETNKMSEGISNLIKDLGESSQKSYDAINNIAENIADINKLVQQTNILALNAAIEAARAGEQGKGFAVVAKEVGRLAGQTHDTAGAITETANESIKESEIAFQNVQDLLPQIEHIASLIREITAASVEQNSGVGQVNSAINELNTVTQSNAASAEELAASTHELQKILHLISNSTKIFKI